MPAGALAVTTSASSKVPVLNPALNTPLGVTVPACEFTTCQSVDAPLSSWPIWSKAIACTPMVSPGERMICPGTGWTCASLGDPVSTMVMSALAWVVTAVRGSKFGPEPDSPELHADKIAMPRRETAIASG